MTKRDQIKTAALSDDPLVGVGNAATICGVSRRTMDNWIDKDQAPPFFFLGSRRYVRQSALQQWLSDKQRRAIIINERAAALFPRAETRAA